MIIAIDGPAASGKGTLGKRLAAHYRLRHLDTGLIYRAVALTLLEDGQPLDDVAAAVAAATALEPGGFDEVAPQGPCGRRGRLAGLGHSGGTGGPARRSSAISRRTPPGAVLDGRDIGTVICPDADVKIFVTATPGGASRDGARWSFRRPAARSTRPKSSPISAAATNATRSAPPPR